MHDYQLMLFEFIIFSTAGWLLEVIYRSLNNKKFVNPGFLAGPYLPIYGIGAVIITTIAYATISVSIIYKFLIYFAALSILEYVSGVLLYILFGKRYWNYLDEPLNIQGFVCLPFSIIWGLLALSFEYALLPMFIHFYTTIPAALVNTIVFSGLTIMMIDCLLTHNVVQKIINAKKAPFFFQHTLPIHFQNDALITLRYFFDNAISYRKKINKMIPPKPLRMVISIKERYALLLQSITKMLNNHNKYK